MARSGDQSILDYAVAGDFVLVTTDRDFEQLVAKSHACVVILRACDYPTRLAADVLRRNAIRIAQLPVGSERLLILES